jgi:flagellar protein FliO/FliZ
MGDLPHYSIRAAAALVFVLSLIGIWAYAARRFSGVTIASSKRQKRLGVIEVTAIDPKRRLVLVRRDQTEHLLLIGGSADLIVESGIAPVALTTPLAEVTADDPGPPPRRSRLDEVRF